MKYKNGFYLQLSRKIFDPKYQDLSTSAKWLYIVLCENEHKFTNGKQKWFYRSDADLAEDTGWSLATVKRAKAELLRTDLVKTKKVHFMDDNGKKSTKRITTYEMT